jgi:hypothetical protein
VTFEAVAPVPAPTGNRRQIQTLPSVHFRMDQDAMNLRFRLKDCNHPLFDSPRCEELRALPPAARRLALLYHIDPTTARVIASLAGFGDGGVRE